MPQPDPFNLRRERKITDSGVRRVFTPHQPIQTTKLFFGREQQVAKLIEHINTPGQHALLYGDRGVGKSSLAIVASKLLLDNLTKGKLYTKRCDSDDTFETIVAEPLQATGFFDQPIERFEKKTEGGFARLKTLFADAGVDTKTEKGSTLLARQIRIQPSTAAEYINGRDGLLLVDEADAIKDPDDKRKLAEFIKQLSDSASPFKVLVVGISHTAAELTGAHPSVQRCLKETHLQRMSSDEIREIIVGGADQLDLKFEDDAVDKIVALSAGYPHFTHLLCLKCAENAIADDHKSISKNDIREAMDQAVGDAEGTLRSQYERAVRSADTDMYRVTVLAAAEIDADEFTAGQLRKSIEVVCGTPIEQNALNNYLTKLVARDESSILKRLAKGVYRFTDPRMPSYVKIANGIVD